MAFWTDGGIAKDPKRNFRFKVEIGGFAEAASDANGGGDTTVWWAKKIQKPNFTTAESKHVFMGHTFYQIDSDDNEIESWTLHHPFIKKISFSDLDYENDELTTIDISLRYDWAECKTANVNDAFFSKNGPALP